MFTPTTSAHRKSAAAAPFAENNLLPDSGTSRRLIDAEALLNAFETWANVNLAPTYDYDDALLFTGYNV